MGVKRLPLVSGGPKRLEVVYGRHYSSAQISLDGSPVATFQRQKDLNTGGVFPLPDGSWLSVKLINGLVGKELQLLINGSPVPGSDSDGDAQIRKAAKIFFFLAALRIVLGSIFLTVWGSPNTTVPAGTLVAYGILCLFLGFFTWNGSRLALGIGLAIEVLDLLLGILIIVTAGPPALSFWGFITKLIIIKGLARGFIGIQSDGVTARPREFTRVSPPAPVQRAPYAGDAGTSPGITSNPQIAVSSTAMPSGSLVGAGAGMPGRQNPLPPQPARITPSVSNYQVSDRRRCPQCSLINFPDASSCRRCGTKLGA